MKKMIYITNIPTPYRTFRFNQLSNILLEQGIELEVLYMNISEPDREWKFKSDEITHQYQIFSYTKVKNILGMWFHLCPKLHRYLLTCDYDYAVLGGLASPAHFIASMLLNKKKVNILSVESNVESIGNKGKLVTSVKQYLMRKFSYFQVTGPRSIDFIKHYVPNLKHENIVTLPNVINEPLFFHTDPEEIDLFIANRFDECKSKGERIVLIPARLIEVKGLIPFLKALTKNLDLHFFIAGEGELRKSIETYIEKNQLKVTLLGNQTPRQVVCMMKHADIIALPSQSDASPLSVIEALYCGVPLLISKNVGNIDEVLVENENGWSFEFDNIEESKAAITKANDTSDDELKKMGKRAKQIFDNNFHSEKVLKNYLNKLLTLEKTHYVR